MMATLVSGPFEHPDWVFEPKFDGLRVLAYFDGRDVRLVSRNDKPQETAFPDVAAALRKTLRRPAVVDGEVVCFDDTGRTSFRAIQQRFHLTKAVDIEFRSQRFPAYLYLFDLLWFDGEDMTAEPLSDRKRLLRRAVRWSDRVRWTESEAGRGKARFEAACRRGDEGIMAKLATSRYVAGRSGAWVKIKCTGRQEFVIGGFTDPQRSRVGLGALLVGYYDGDKLVYAGKVGTGYTYDTLLDLRRRINGLEQTASPFGGGKMPHGRGVHWVRPQLVAEIAFAEWTQHGLLRQPRFKGLRTDKPPREIRRERPRPAGEQIDKAESTMATKRRSSATTLKEYRAKRNFRATPEPGPGREKSHRKPIFVIQEHHARRLHYDFRLESRGVLKSWAVTNEPTTDPAVKRLAVRVEDHPLAYAKFSGDIPAGQYGAGHVEIWDHGTYESAEPGRSIEEGLNAGKLSIVLHGERLNGRFALVRMRGKGEKRENWLLIKSRDEFTTSDVSPTRKRGRQPPSLARRANQPLTNGKKQKQPPSLARRAHKSLANGKPPSKIEITNPNKILFPDDGITKLDVVEYYRKVADRLLPFLRNRATTLERLPDGMGPGKPHFWQKNTPEYYPRWIPRFEETAGRGQMVQYVVVNDVPALLYLVNQGALTFHPWLSRIDDIDRPDTVLFDLDPGGAPFVDVVTVAKRVRDVLEEEGAEPFVKTSGKSGLHVLTAWGGEGGFDAARAWAARIARGIAEEMPDLATAEVRKAKRGGKVYVDVGQNARAHHAVPPYVLRAVPGAPASTPLQWREVTSDLDPARFNLRTIPARIARQRRDPMAPLLGMG
jgi:bifunctional non-homologous end joining protein LigD